MTPINYINKIDWQSKTVRFSFYDGACFSIMAGLGETFIPAFLLATGGNAVQAGLVTTLPMMVGAILQLILLRTSFKRFKSFRSWVVVCALLQASIFVPLVFFAVFHSKYFTLTYILVCIYWCAALAAGPAWNAWIDGVVEAVRRPAFFALRSRLCQIMVFVGFIAGGLILQRFNVIGDEMLGFALIFALSALFRALSAWCLFRHEEFQGQASNRKMLSIREFIRRFVDGSAQGKYVIYLTLVYGAAYFAAPFFTPFMLKSLELSYAQYVMLVAASFAGKALSYPALGRFSNRYGLNKLLLFSGLGVVPTAGMWILSDNFYYLFAIQFYAGVAWAGFELAAVLYTFNVISVPERTSVLAYISVLQSTMMTLGSICGGVMLTYYDSSYFGYMAVFMVSCVLRALTIIPLFRASDVKPRFRIAAFRVLGVRPSGGGIDRPIVTDQVMIDKRKA